MASSSFYHKIMNSFPMTGTNANIKWTGIIDSGISNSKLHSQAHVPKQFPHTLRIINHEADYGQDDYHEDLEWEIVHYSECEHEVHTDSQWLPRAFIPTMKVYTCPVGYYVNHDGIYTLLDESGVNIDWKSLEPGDYSIEAWSAHYPSTPASPEEYDGGLRLK